MKRIIAALAASAAISTSLVVATATAAQAVHRNNPCITKKEFRHIHRGMTVTTVRHIVGARGSLTSSNTFSDGDAWATRDFRACKPLNKYSSVSVDFEKTEKQVWVPDVECSDWNWDTGACIGYTDYGSYETVYRFPMRVVSKSAFWLHN